MGSLVPERGGDVIAVTRRVAFHFMAHDRADGIV